MQLVEKAIQDTAHVIKEQHTIDWSQMLNLIHLTGMEKSLKNQYQNATNIVEMKFPAPWSRMLGKIEPL